MQHVTGQIADIPNKRFYPGIITIEGGRIARIDPWFAGNPDTGDITISDHFILPGFIDAHIHIESSMLVPSEFARLAVAHGTVATVSDPHEIANVCGMAGIDFMIANGKQTPFKFHFGAPSCVPATIFETAGATINEHDIRSLLSREDIHYLSEMMNYPGVLHNDPTVMNKISIAHGLNKPVDGHAPGLRGKDAHAYIQAGITTDHECFTLEEAEEKLKYGMKVLIREGSAAKNFEALIGLLEHYPAMIMFCSDDKHPDSLVEGHINQLCARAAEKKIDVFKILQAACINPVSHYRMNVGLLKQGDPADFIVVKDLETFSVLQTYIDGDLVFNHGRSLITRKPIQAVNQFHPAHVTAESLRIHKEAIPLSEKGVPVIGVLDGQLVTEKLFYPPKFQGDLIVSDPDNDLLKIVVVNRYTEAPASKALIRNFGMKAGAIASSVAHDSHNIVAVGVDDDMIAKAINLVMQHQGGISCVGRNEEMILPLPVAGLMSMDDGYEVAEAYTKIDRMAKALGSTLSAPFMSLSFMALLVIPHIKLSDRGLFDGDHFHFITTV